MIEQLSYNGQLVDISIDATLVNFDEGNPGRFAIAKALQEHAKDFSLFSDNVLYMEDEAAANVAAQLVAIFTELSLDQGELTVILPFDMMVYVAKVDILETYILVSEERIVQIEQALEIARTEDTVEVLEGGQLTDVFRQNRIEVLEETLDFDDFVLAKAMTVSAMVMTGVAGLAAIILIAMVVNLFVIQGEEVPTNIVRETKGERLLEPDLRDMADMLVASNVFLAHGLTSITQDGAIGRAPYITISGDYGDLSYYRRLSQLSNKFGSGTFVVTGNSWSISSIRGISNEAAEETLRSFDADIDQLLIVLRNYSNVIRFETPVSGRDYTDYPVSVTITHPNSTMLNQLADEVSSLPIHARVTAFTFEADPTAAWLTVTIQIHVRGSLP